MKKRSEKADPSAKKVRSLLHSKAKRKRIPTAQSQPFMTEEQQKPIPAKYQRPNAAPSPAMEAAADERNTDLDPQLIWEGKDRGAAAELSANAPPIYIQEKIHPQALMEDLMRESQQSRAEAAPEPAPDLFAEYDGLPQKADKAEFAFTDALFDGGPLRGLLKEDCNKAQRTVKAQSIFEEMLAERKQSSILFLFPAAGVQPSRKSI